MTRFGLRFRLGDFAQQAGRYDKGTARADPYEDKLPSASTLGRASQAATDADSGRVAAALELILK